MENYRVVIVSKCRFDRVFYASVLGWLKVDGITLEEFERIGKVRTAVMWNDAN